MNKKVSKELLDYAREYGIDYNSKYLFKENIVIPVIDSESYQGALGHGFVHYKDSKGKIKYCGVCHFKENAKRYEIG